MTTYKNQYSFLNYMKDIEFLKAPLKNYYHLRVHHSQLRILQNDQKYVSSSSNTESVRFSSKIKAFDPIHLL